VHVPGFSDSVASVAALAQPGDMVLTLGAGSVSQLGPLLLEKLQSANQLGTVSILEKQL
jgi:UDP-N-acetylmuramate--alanine ligase